MSSYQEFIVCPYCGWDYAGEYTENYFTISYCNLCNWRESEVNDDLINELWPEAESDAEEQLGKSATDEEINKLAQKFLDGSIKDYLENKSGADYSPKAIDIKISKKIQKDFNSLDGLELHNYVLEFGPINKATYKKFYKSVIKNIFE